MSKRTIATFFSILTAFSMTGCATTGRNYQTDIDATNAKVAAMQGQLSEKDQEIARLQSELNEQRSAASQAESEKRALADRLADAERRSAAKAVSSARKSDADQYLK